jgi:protein-S-isoprenylcysteine O-methyltransferase Ste14
MLRKAGKPSKSRDEETLFEFEKTSQLVGTGIFKYIRHPLYSSLLFLTWGILLKNPDRWLIGVAALSSAFLFLTAVFDEKECIAYFGEKYKLYMKTTKRFISYIF